MEWIPSIPGRPTASMFQLGLRPSLGMACRAVCDQCDQCDEFPSSFDVRSPEVQLEPAQGGHWSPMLTENCITAGAWKGAEPFRVQGHVGHVLGFS